MLGVDLFAVTIILLEVWVVLDPSYQSEIVALMIFSKVGEYCFFIDHIEISVFFKVYEMK